MAGSPVVIDWWMDVDGTVRLRDRFRPGTLPVVGDRLGLHVTQQELDIWRERWDNGVIGDTFLTSRITEEKSRITNNRNTFDSNPATWAVEGASTDSDGCYDSGPSMQAHRPAAARVRDASFYGLVTNDPGILAKVRTNLLQQAQREDVQFSQSPPWCPLNQAMRNINIMFSVTHTIMTTLFAYDYFNIAVGQGIAQDMSPAEHDIMRTWFTDYADFLLPSMDFFMGHGFVDRLNDNYNLTSTYADPNFLWQSGNIYQGGPKNHRLHRLFTNPYIGSARYIASVGVMFDDATFKSRAHRAARDWIRYHLYPEGVSSDAYRGWNDAWGFNQYGMLGGGYVMIIMDTLARDGDTSLYDYQTTDGEHDSAGAPPIEYGGQKSLLFYIQSLARHGNNTFERYNNSNELLNLRTGSQGNLGHHDRLIMANMYYQDTGLCRDFYRGINGQPTWMMALNARGTSGGGTDLNGNWSFAAPYLQWAGLEGQVWPYPEDD